LEALLRHNYQKSYFIIFRVACQDFLMSYFFTFYMNPKHFSGTIFFHNMLASNHDGLVSVFYKGQRNDFSKLKKQLNIAENKNQTDTIAEAYSILKEKVFQEIDGAFIVIIVDKNEQKILLARDRFGIEPLYFVYTPNHSLAFSQSLADLNPSTLNADKIKEYLSYSSGYQLFNTQTFYQNIHALLPAHIHIFDKNSHTYQPYWLPQIKVFNDFSDNLYENFKEKLYHSVQKNIEGHPIICGHLSGGMDSSAICGVAAQLTPHLHTFYIQTHLASTDESAYARLVANHIGSQHQEIEPLADVYEALHQLSTFFHRPEHFILPASFHLGVSEKVKAIGGNVILTGHDGDTVAGHGLGYIQQLQKNADWQMLNTQLENIAIHFNLSYIEPNWLNLHQQKQKKLYKNTYWNRILLDNFKRKDFGEMWRLMRVAKQYFGYVPSHFITYLTHQLWKKIEKKNPPDSVLATDFQAPKTDDLHLLYEMPDKTILEQFRAATNKQFIEINEELFAIGNHYGHQYAFPFFDKNLLELSMSVPDFIKFGNGKSRALLRNALTKELPEKLLKRGDKTEFSEYSLASFKKLWMNHTEKFKTNDLLWQYVSREKFNAHCSFILNDKIPIHSKSRSLWYANRVLYLGVWLNSLKGL
jgi:asparagine synthase (glutamine-hydrolysing)